MSNGSTISPYIDCDMKRVRLHRDYRILRETKHISWRSVVIRINSEVKGNYIFEEGTCR